MSGIVVRLRYTVILLVCTSWLCAGSAANPLDDQMDFWRVAAINDWNRAPTIAYDCGIPRASYMEKAASREKLKNSIYVFRYIGRQGMSGTKMRKAARRLIREIEEVGRILAPNHTDQIAQWLELGVPSSLGSFINHANQEHASLGSREVFQAGRNYAVATVFNILNQRPTSLTGPLYYYSVLYPLTDNVIDDTSLPKEKVKEFVVWLSGRIEGRTSNPVSTDVDAALSRIEQYYPRADYPLVYHALATVNSTQVASTLQDKTWAMKPVAPGSSDPVLDVTFDKGGAALIGDAYIAFGQANSQQLQCMYNFGVLCQLLDDFQDLKQDSETHHATVFSRARANGESVQLLANKLMWFSDYVCRQQAQSNTENAGHADLLRIACYYYICTGIALNTDAFTADYIRSVEAQIPVSIADIRTIYKSMDGKGGDRFINGIKVLAQ